MTYAHRRTLTGTPIHPMHKLLPLTALLLTLPIASADEVLLRDKSSLTGRILAEKTDQVFVDIGYTVIAVPRTQITNVLRTSAKPASPKGSKKSTDASQKAPAPAAAATDTKNLFTVNTTPPPERSVRELMAQLGQAVVQVRTPGGLGSGFIVSEEGYLITNFHVIEGETQISIEVFHQLKGQMERKAYKQVRIVAMHKFADLALLKIEDPGAPKFSRVPLGDSDLLAVGERIFAIGSPLGLERTVTEGILSTKTRQMQGSLYLQTTTQINPGNSGGPLFNLRGEVVGVTNMKITFGEGLGFAIPIEQVKHFLSHRDAYAYDTDNPSNAYRYLPPPSRTKQIEAKGR
ncbi:MAG: trypsin-like peptidase domain-containing protein [Limisphaerales bacterium]